MPVYEYECTKCGRQTEVWQKISDADMTSCEHCKGKVKKIISQSSFHLKGTGWYVTDYKSKKESEKKSQKSETKAETKSADDKPKKEAAPSADKSKSE
jgi:putative FmdB family regulatory protein